MYVRNEVSNIANTNNGLLNLIQIHCIFPPTEFLTDLTTNHFILLDGINQLPFYIDYQFNKLIVNL